jgi:hypothetical protein
MHLVSHLTKIATHGNRLYCQIVGGVLNSGRNALAGNAGRLNRIARSSLGRICQSCQGRFGAPMYLAGSNSDEMKALDRKIWTEGGTNDEALECCQRTGRGQADVRDGMPSYPWRATSIDASYFEATYSWSRGPTELEKL